MEITGTHHNFCLHFYCKNLQVMFIFALVSETSVYDNPIFIFLYCSHCPKKCMPMSLPEVGSDKLFPYCETLEEYACMQNAFKGMYKYFLDAAKMCPGFCTTLEYDARLYLQISYKDVSPGYE